MHEQITCEICGERATRSFERPIHKSLLIGIALHTKDIVRTECPRCGAYFDVVSADSFEISSIDQS